MVVRGVIEEQAEDTGGGETCWPPSFPHVEIDRLMERLDRGEVLGEAELRWLLTSIGREAQRLRLTVAQLAARTRAEAHTKASLLVAQAQSQSEALRASGVQALLQGIQEAEELSAASRFAASSRLASAHAGAVGRP